MSIGIYALYWEKPDLIYIGKTITLEKRYSQHLELMSRCKHYNYKVQEAYVAYGPPQYVILAEVPLETLNQEEISLIKEFDCYNTSNGLNLTPGGDGAQGEEHPNSIYPNSKIEEVFLLLYNRKTTHKEIAQITGVHLDVIKAISAGKLHGWLHSKYPIEYTTMLSTIKCEHNAGEAHSLSTIPNTKVREIFDYLVVRDVPLTEIADRCKVSYGIVSLIACGKSHAWLEQEYPDRYVVMLSNRGKLIRSYPKITNGTEIVELHNVSQFCIEQNLQHSNLSKVLKGTRLSHKGWRVLKEL